MADKTVKCLSWVVTVNQGSYIAGTLDYENMEQFIKNHFNYAYACWNEEKGLETGNLHMHVYLEVENPISFDSIRKKFNKSHVEKRFGNPSEARAYVEKEVGTVFDGHGEDKSQTVINPIKEIGDWSLYKDITARGSGKGKNNKVDVNTKLKNYIEQYNTYEEVEDADLWFAKQYKEAIIKRLEKKQMDKLYKEIGITIKAANGLETTVLRKKVYYLYSKQPRIGKNFGIRMKYGYQNVYVANCEKQKPFDDYKSHHSILQIDEFRSSLALSFMLNFLDVYEATVERRYLNALLMAHTVIITTNHSINEQYPNVQNEKPQDFKAFKERFINGIWELVYDKLENISYIFCESKIEDYDGQTRGIVDFSEPPINIDNERVIHITDEIEFNAIKALINAGEATTAENITDIVIGKRKLQKEDEEKETVEIKTSEEIQKDNEHLKEEIKMLYEILLGKKTSKETVEEILMLKQLRKDIELSDGQQNIKQEAE